MGIFDASQSSGGSAQQSFNNSQAEAYSTTDGSAAREWSAQQAAIAREWSAQQAQINRDFQERMFNKEMEFNAAEAQKSRDYTQAQVDIANKMADTVYTRAAANMKEAGINPILAYSHGLAGVGSGSVSSGQSASVGAPAGSQAQTFMGQSFADMNSASKQYSHGEGTGSSWNNSTSGFTTAAEQLAGMFGKIADGLSSGLKIDVGASIDKLIDALNPPEEAEKLDEKVQKELEENTKKKSNSYKKEQRQKELEDRKGHQGTGALGAGRGSEKVVY